MNPHYPHLFSAFQLGGLSLPNRLVMGSIHTGLEEAPDGPVRLAAFYAERARAGVGLIITGGIAPNAAGALSAHGAVLDDAAQIAGHRLVTDAVHRAGGRICLQILHAGRYAAHPAAVAPSPLQSAISPYSPRELSEAGIEATLADFVRCARLAEQAGYDGIEIMGSEGYLISQFLAPRTNRRTDGWGGDFAGRSRFALEAVARIRAAVGADFLVIFRQSLLDLVEQGSSWEEVVALARGACAAGANAIDTGIGWHEARIPTIASIVPPGAFSWVTRRLRAETGLPVIATNRINRPELAEALLAEGQADLVSLARPFLADAEFAAKSAQGRGREINTCIGCNQSCLDRIFSGRSASCLVNPRACRETEWLITAAPTPRRFAVVGAGPAGLACATTLAERGHAVTLFERAPHIGGQFDLARRIPGKEDYAETLRYFSARLATLAVDVRLGTAAAAPDLLGFDHVVLATGVVPRRPDIPGIDHAKVAGYAEILDGRAAAGGRVAIIGAGGIGFDVAEFLLHQPYREAADFLAEWGVDVDYRERGGLCAARPAHPGRSVWLLQRSPGRPGERLAKTTGWIRRLRLARAGAGLLAGVDYLGIDERGIRFRHEGAEKLLEVDTIVVCAGQESQRALEPALRELGIAYGRIGGADVAAELDAARAMEQGVRTGLAL